MAVGACVGLWLCLGLWFVVASDYGDNVVSGTYVLSHDNETCTLILRRDHRFDQTVSRGSVVQHASGTWRHVSFQSGVAFSKEFVPLTGQDLSGDGTAYGDVNKMFGLLPDSLTLSTYHVEWYGRVDPASGDSVAGTYAGDEEGVKSLLVIKPDHTFNQTVSRLGVAKRAIGAWNFKANGDISFSKSFLKSTGEAIGDDETATSENPKGSPLQIEIEVVSRLGVPTFRKRLLSQ